MSVKKTWFRIFQVPIYYNAIRQFSSTQTNESEQNVVSKKKTLEGGVVIVDITLGSGSLAKSGKTVRKEFNYYLITFLILHNFVFSFYLIKYLNQGKT